jgi:hypothetical protein
LRGRSFWRNAPPPILFSSTTERFTRQSSLADAVIAEGNTIRGNFGDLERQLGNLKSGLRFAVALEEQESVWVEILSVKKAIGEAKNALESHDRKYSSEESFRETVLNCLPIGSVSLLPGTQLAIRASRSVSACSKRELLSLVLPLSRHRGIRGVQKNEFTRSSERCPSLRRCVSWIRSSLRGENTRVPARDALQLVLAELLAIDLDATLGAAERDIHHRALVGHEGGERHHLVFAACDGYAQRASRRSS